MTEWLTDRQIAKRLGIQRKSAVGMITTYRKMGYEILQHSNKFSWEDIIRIRKETGKKRHNFNDLFSGPPTKETLDKLMETITKVWRGETWPVGNSVPRPRKK